MSYTKLLITVVIAMSLVLGVYEWYNVKRSKQYLSVAYIGEGLSAGAAVKMHIEEYYFGTGEFPSSNQELNLPAPEEFIGQSLTSLEVEDNGVITLKFNEKSGVKNGAIQLIPETNPTMGIKWRCITTSYQNIALKVPQCEYTLEP